MSMPPRIAFFVLALLLTIGELGATSGISQQTKPLASTSMVEFEAKARLVSLLPDYIRRTSGQDARQLVIGIIGESPFENHLNEIFGPGKTQSRKGRLVYYHSLKGIETCDLIFICESESERLSEILRKVKGSPILTIGDTPGFAHRGVMVNFLLDPNKDRIGLEVNLAVLRLAALEASPHFLKKTKVVD